VYTRDSRYRHVDEVTRLDRAGRQIVVTDLRRRPARPGTFVHTVDDGDRLDHLGSRYYRRPGQWWRIADANPELLSPLRLLGHDPLRTVRLVVPAADAPPWSSALRALGSTAGVEHVSFALEQRRQGPDDVVVGVLTVHFNSLTVPVEQLLALLTDEGFAAGPVEWAGRLGKPLVIPPPGPA
jgi:hypothetical protein